MGGIYLGSLVTIAVSASASAENGCLNSTSQQSTELKDFEGLVAIRSKLQDGQKSCLCFLDMSASIPDMYEDEVVNSPLSSRAWTFQEFVLPQRILYFTSKQLLWECMHCRLSEGDFPQIQSDRPYPILDFEYVLDVDTIASFWYAGAIEQYSQRQMTVEKDKLVAISALARATYYNRPSDYVVGLWRGSLLLGLTWTRSSDGSKSKSFTYPSWSWASQKSAVSYSFAAKTLDYLDDQKMKRRSPSSEETDENLKGRTSKVIAIDWKSDPANAFGNVSDAYIDLRTVVGIGTVVRDHFNKNGLYYDQEKESQGIMILYTSKSGKAEWWHVKATMDDSNVSGGQFTLALLRESTFYNSTFLLLEPADLSAGTFRRVGLVEMYDLYDDGNWRYFTKDWEEKVIRLV